MAFEQVDAYLALFIICAWLPFAILAGILDNRPGATK